MSDELEKLIKSAPLEIKKDFRHRTFEQDTVIIRDDSKNNILHLLVSGCVEVHKSSLTGINMMMNYFEAFDFFGEIELFCPDLPTYKVVAKTNCDIILLNKESVFKWIELDQRFPIFLLSALSRRLYLTSDSFSQTTLLPLKNRVLGQLWEQYLLGELDHYTKEMLVKDVRSPLRSVNRVIHEAIENKLIDYSDKKFIILNLSVMESYAYNHYL